MLLATTNAVAVEHSDSVTTTRKRSVVTRFLDYFNDANKGKKKRGIDFSIIGGPHYSTDTKLGVGLVASGLYHSAQRDSLLPPSNISVFSDFSTVGFYMIGIRGTHIFPGDSQRIDYTTYFYSFPSYFWGVGFDQGDNDDNKSKLKRGQAQVKASWLFRASGNLFIGPTFSFDYINAHHIDNPELLGGQRHTTTNIGAGLTLLYDTRDNLTAPKRGMYLSLQQVCRPRFMANHYAFSSTALRTSGYIPISSTTLIALDFRTEFNYGNPAWGMMAQLGGSNTMRGYYEGRYRDKNKMEGEIELRQHVWKRNGIVAWAGLGTVFNKFSSMRARNVLPNFGLGYRWEFKKNVNVRLDYGFGKSGQSGFLFNINEAF